MDDKLKTVLKSAYLGYDTEEDEENSEEIVENSPTCSPKNVKNPQGHLLGLRSSQIFNKEPMPLPPLTPNTLIFPGKRCIETLGHSSPKSHFNPSEQTVEAPLFSPITPREPLETVKHMDTSIEAPPYSPLTPKPHNSCKPQDDEHNTAPIDDINDFSPLPLMSPETSKLFNILANSDFIDDDDDSVNDPDYKSDDNETYCSDDSDMQIHNTRKYKNITVNETDSETDNNDTQNILVVENGDLHVSEEGLISDGTPHAHENISAAENGNSRVSEEEQISEGTEHAHENISAAENGNLRVNEEEQISEGTEHAHENIAEGRPKRGRKRKSNLSREEVKQRKYNNLPYTNRKNNVIASKKFVDYRCSCKQNCSELVSREKREQEFVKYVNLGSYSAQIAYIIACVKEHRKKRTYITQSETRKPKEFSRIYSLTGIKVCRDMFVNTLQVTPQKITVSLQKMRNGELLQDKRGVAQGGWNKIQESDVEVAVNVIRRLPKYTSHYRRDKTDAMYLQPGMKVLKMYEIYKEEFNALPDKEERKCLSLSMFKQIFLKKFNLRCKSLKKDTCNKCDTYAVQNGMNNDHEKHLKLAEDLRSQMKNDFQRAKLEKNLECITFDLEKTLPLPRIPTNIVFYKRQLWVYNSGIHSASDDKGYCYVWVEGEAGRGAQEVGSCLLRHIDTKLPADTEHHILWSDSCGGQNRNIKLTLMMKAALHSHENLKTISLRFLEPGHTFLPNDTDFSKIETRLKGIQRLYTVEDYMTVMRECRKRNPLQVVRMQSVDFQSSSLIEKKIVNRKVLVTKNKVNWLGTKEILLRKESLHSIFMRSDFKMEYEELNIKKRTAGRGVIQRLSIDRSDLVPLWPNGREIAEPKLKDIQAMMHLIPNDAKGFYESLKGSQRVVDDLEGFGTPDFEVEEFFGEEYLDEEYLDT